MNEVCPIVYDHDDLDLGHCAVCGWEAGGFDAPVPSHPDDMPTATGPERIRRAIAIDRGGYAPQAPVCFDGDGATS